MTVLSSPQDRQRYFKNGEGNIIFQWNNKRGRDKLFILSIFQEART